MKKFIFAFICIFSLTAQAEILFFTREGCPFCMKAKEYITTNHPKNDIRLLDITQKENLNMFIECAKRFKLDEKKLGIPLICAENDYIMGWNQEKQEKLQQLLSKR